MLNKNPLIVMHRRNKLNQLEGLPMGCWIEIDIEIFEDVAYLTHDPIIDAQSLPIKFEDFVPEALGRGVVGFVVDCKREGAEKWVKPVFNKLGVTDYFFLNEMEVQADIYQSQDVFHKSGIRIWKYRGAADVIRMASDMKLKGEEYPKWVWFDCWQRGLLSDINKAYVPMTGDDARQLQSLDIKLCICSPELYVHKYDTDYNTDEFAGFYSGIMSYRQRLAEHKIYPDAICTKFPDVWQKQL